MRKKIKLPDSVGVIISTYNNPSYLEKVLWGYACQTFRDFEIVIADDGSTEETGNMINRFKQQTGIPIKHVWQTDEGFQKSRILNKAILSTESEYLIFTDQDCIPRKDFVETHLLYSEKGYFLSGGNFKLPPSVSQIISKEDIEKQNSFSLKWLKNQGIELSFKCTKLFKSKTYARSLNFITPAKASWNGCNASGWRSDFIAVNGFNEDIQYGGQDREFGERLFNYGVKSKQIRYSAICVHLDHQRPYKFDEILRKNKVLRKQIRKTHQIETSHGIRKL